MPDLTDLIALAVSSFRFRYRNSPRTRHFVFRMRGTLLLLVVCAALALVSGELTVQKVCISFVCIVCRGMDQGWILSKKGKVLIWICQ